MESEALKHSMSTNDLWEWRDMISEMKEEPSPGGPRQFLHLPSQYSHTYSVGEEDVTKSTTFSGEK